MSLAPENELTPGERRITALVAAGLTNKDIAADLRISVETVKRHLVNVMNKTGCDNRTALAVWWLVQEENSDLGALRRRVTALERELRLVTRQRDEWKAWSPL